MGRRGLFLVGRVYWGMGDMKEARAALRRMDVETLSEGELTPEELSAHEGYQRRLERGREYQRAARQAQAERWGFPADIAGILAMLDTMPTRDEVAAMVQGPPVPREVPPAEPRRRGGSALTGAAAAGRNRRLTRLRYRRLTEEQRAERNRKRRANYARKAALLQR